MGLEEYEKKRAFEKTPEPRPEKPPLMGKNRFVIHYHDASHLHYDLRLEIGGTLKSWAVPKGLPTRQSVKKLAVQVEDHPIEYLSFEGQIPQGEYGAGTVKIFDTGTFEPNHPGNLQDRLAKGRIGFTLKGKKIKGAFNLVQMRRGKDWLLMLASEESLNPWLYQQGIEGQMPKQIIPMKAALTDRPFDSKEWIYEIKWDGIRAIAYLNDGHLGLLSRNFHEQNFRYPELANLGDFILGNKAVLDGEIVAFDEKGLPSFEVLQSRINLNSKKEIDYHSNKTPVIYYVFDLLFWQSRDLMQLPLWQRRIALESVTIPHKHIQISEEIDKEGIAFFKAAKQQGLEGILAKRKDSRYEQKRSSAWLKIKAVLEQEVVIGGFTEPRGTRSYFGALLLGVYDNSHFVYVGHAGAGFSEQALKDLYEAMAQLEIARSPFKHEPKTNEKAHWIKPKLVAEVKFTEWTRAGVMRQPSFLGLRTDINPREVHKEIATSLGSSQ